MKTLCPWDYFEKVPYQYCEELQCSWVVQPANTISNIFFLMIGIIILIHSKKVSGKASFIGIMAIFVGLCSTFFHMSFTHWGGMADLASMMIIAAYLLNFNLAQFGIIRSIQRGLWTTLIICMIPSHFLSLHFHYLSGVAIFALLFMLTLITEIYKLIKHPTIPKKYLMQMLGSFAIGFGFNLADVTGLVACNPQEHLFQMHVFWHLFSAISIFFFYRHLNCGKTAIVE